MKHIIGFAVVNAVLLGGAALIAYSFRSLYTLVVLLDLPDWLHGVAGVAAVILAVLIGAFGFRLVLGARRPTRIRYPR